MKNLLTGLTFSLLPIYSFISWLNVFANKNLRNQEERIIEFKKTLFNIDIDFKFLSLINIVFIFLAIFFLTKSFKYNNSSIYKGISLILIISLIFILIYNIWGLL